ncbi:MAG: hypothetical protein AB7S26_19315 [Sandaracinaceae bacterium]
MSEPSVLLPLARLLPRAESSATTLLGAGARVSLPIPLGTDDGVARYAFLASRVARSDDGESLAIYAPRFVVSLSATDGSLIAVRRTLPRDYGIDASPDVPVGAARTDAPSDESRLARARVEQAIDRLAPVYFGMEGPSRDVQRVFAQSFLGAFDAASEPALVPFTRAVAEDFLGWLEQR